MLANLKVDRAISTNTSISSIPLWHTPPGIIPSQSTPGATGAAHLCALSFLLNLTTPSTLRVDSRLFSLFLSPLRIPFPLYRVLSPCSFLISDNFYKDFSQDTFFSRNEPFAKNTIDIYSTPSGALHRTPECPDRLSTSQLSTLRTSNLPYISTSPEHSSSA